MYLIIKQSQLGNTFVNSTVFVTAELIMNPHSLILPLALIQYMIP